jgi:hypothetical protein
MQVDASKDSRCKERTALFPKLLGGKVLSHSPGQKDAIITVVIVVADRDHCGARYLDWRVDDV